MSQYAQSDLVPGTKRCSNFQPVRSFFDITPAEIRVQIYKNILHTDAALPGGSKLNEYRGLILSCKEIGVEFEYEWAKVFNEALRTLLSNPLLPSALHASSVSSFRDLKDVRIFLSEDAHDMTDNYIDFAVERMLKTLLKSLHTFSIHPATRLKSLRNRKSIYSWYLALRCVVEGFMELEMGNFKSRFEDFDDSEDIMSYYFLPSPPISIRKRRGGLFIKMPHVRVFESFRRRV